jgi:gamma-glutamyltranspeptidase/glutathione hydrolase
VACCALLGANCAAQQLFGAPAQPEAASGYQAQSGWASKRFSIAAAHPLATQAGYRILQAGGSAVDAAIASQMVLALVEPQSSGLGGGTFLVHFDGAQVTTFDGRETAPALATEQLFTNDQGQTLPFGTAVVSGRAVGVPGTLHLLALAHQRHGKLAWARLFESAIALAENGFVIGARMGALLAQEKHLVNDPVAAAYFYDAQGQPWPAGHLLKNPELAAILKAIAQQGPRALSQGEIAHAIVNKVQNAPHLPGQMTLADLAHYQAKERPALCFDHAAPSAAQASYRICGMPPPSSGTVAIAQILGILAHTQAAQWPLDQTPQGLLPNARWLHLYMQAAKLAFADRAKYLADPDFVSPPGEQWETLLAPTYLRQRSTQISADPDAPDMKEVRAGQPAAQTAPLASMPEQAEHGTSHLSVVDAWGHALAMTSTIEDAWGARLMVNRGRGLTGGFLLNNELTDFSFLAQDGQGQPIANRVQGGKRPRSSMSPILVFDKATGQLRMSLGSSGGAFIIHATAKTLYGVLHWGLDVQEAIALPNFGTLGGPTVLEAQRFPNSTSAALQQRGHVVESVALTSGLHAIERTAEGWFGGADPRREGVVLGD